MMTANEVGSRMRIADTADGLVIDILPARRPSIIERWSLAGLLAAVVLFSFTPRLFKEATSTDHGPDIALFFPLLMVCLALAFLLNEVLWGLFGRERIILHDGELSIERQLFRWSRRHRVDSARVRRIVIPDRYDNLGFVIAGGFFSRFNKGAVQLDCGPSVSGIGLSLALADAELISDALENRLPELIRD